MHEITENYIRQLRQEHDSYRTAVAVADAKRKEIEAALMAEFGLTIDQVPIELERMRTELSAAEIQLQTECAQLQQQLAVAQSTIQSA